MVGKRGHRAQKHVRSFRTKAKRRRVRISHRIASTGHRPSAVTRYSALRSFAVYPKKAQPNGRNPGTADIWLDKLYKYGLMALRLFTVLLTSPKIERGRTVAADWTFAITSTCQGFWIGVDDMLINSPISESIDRFGKNYFAKFDYRQGRISSLTVSITPGAKLAERAGEYVVAIVFLSIEQSTMVVDPNYPPKGGVVYLPDSVSFEQAMQYPNAVVCPCDKPTQLTVYTSGNAAEWHRIGHYIETADTVDFPGGPPIAKLVIGYRDMSSSKPDATYLYTPDESLLQVEITSKMSFREPGTSYIRTSPLKSMNVSSIHATIGSKEYSIPVDSVRQLGALISVPHSVMTEILDQEMITY